MNKLCSKHENSIFVSIGTFIEANNFADYFSKEIGI